MGRRSRRSIATNLRLKRPPTEENHRDPKRIDNKTHVAIPIAAEISTTLVGNCHSESRRTSLGRPRNQVGVGTTKTKFTQLFESTQQLSRENIIIRPDPANQAIHLTVATANLLTVFLSVYIDSKVVLSFNNHLVSLPTSVHQIGSWPNVDGIVTFIRESYICNGISTSMTVLEKRRII